MKVSSSKTIIKPVASAQPSKPVKNRLQKRYVDLFSVRVKVDQKERDKKSDFSYHMLDSVRIKRDIPGTDFKKGMQGAIVTLGGDPPTLVEVEVIDPPFIKVISVDDIELVIRD